MIKHLLKVFCLSFIITSFPIHSDQGDQSSTTFDTTDGVPGIEIIGEINRNTADVVHQAFKVFEDGGYKKVVIHLNSPGGDVDAGADIITDMLKAENDYGMTVSAYVDHREYCASMCTVVFGSANFRVAAWDSRWAFHSPYLELSDADKKDPEVMKEADEELAASRKFLLSVYSSVDPDWTEKVLKKYVMSPDKALRLTGAQIIDQSPWWIDYVLDDDLN